MSSPALKMYIFYCARYPGNEQLASRRFPGVVKTISLPCSGKIDVPYLLKAFETGADGVVIVTCGRNECQHLEGNLRAQKRAQAVDDLLGEIGMEPGLIRVIPTREGGFPDLIKEIDAFAESVQKSLECRTDPMIPNAKESGEIR